MKPVFGGFETRLKFIKFGFWTHNILNTDNASRYKVYEFSTFFGTNKKVVIPLNLRRKLDISFPNF